MKRKYKYLLSVLVIILVTVGVIFLLPGGDDKKDGGEIKNKPQTPATETGSPTEEGRQEPAGGATESRIPELPTEAGTVAATERRVTEEPATEELPDGSGMHKGMLGSSYEIPEGFLDHSPGATEDGYIFLYENREYDMTIQVAEFHLDKKQIGFDMEYSILHNMYGSDTGTQVTYDKKEDDHYVISGYTKDRTRVFYVEGFKHPDRNEVQITSEYPNDGTKPDCDRMLEVLQDSLRYDFVSNPDQKQEEETEAENETQ